jgi:AcrR family transcriptional regulator
MPARDDLLGAVADHALAAGIGDLALRPLAAAVGTNARMLIYHFRSKEALVQAILAECRRRRVEAMSSCPTDSFEATWAFVSSRRVEQHARLGLEVEALAALSRKEFVKEARKVSAEWQALFASRGKKSSAAAAACRGLLLDLFSTGDRARVNSAAHELALLFDQRART